MSPPFQSRCKESRWTGAGPPGDRRGQERLSGSLWGRVVQLNHSPTLRAPQSYRAVKKAVIRRNVVPTRTVLHCDKTCGAHMCRVHTGHVRIGDDMFYTQHVPQSIQVLRTLPPPSSPPVHSSTASHLLQQGWVVSLPMPSIIPRQERIKDSSLQLNLKGKTMTPGIAAELWRPPIKLFAFDLILSFLPPR